MSEADKSVKHPEIEWNATTKEWFCIRCFRTSDHVTKLDAERELSEFDCIAFPENGEKSKNRKVN